MIFCYQRLHVGSDKCVYAGNMEMQRLDLCSSWLAAILLALRGGKDVFGGVDIRIFSYMRTYVIQLVLSLVEVSTHLLNTTSYVLKTPAILGNKQREC